MVSVKAQLRQWRLRVNDLSGYVFFFRTQHGTEKKDDDLGKSGSIAVDQVPLLRTK